MYSERNRPNELASLVRLRSVSSAVSPIATNRSIIMFAPLRA